MAAKKTDTGRESGRGSPGLMLLWLLVLVSILLNVVVLNQLLSLRRTAAQALGETSALLGDLREETIALSIPIDQTIVFDTDLPVEQTVIAPIRTDLPISTEVTARVDAGLLGDIPLTVPIETTVPLDMEVAIPIDQTFAVRAPVALSLEVPVEIVVADTPLDATLAQVQESLDGMSDQLGASPFAGL